MEPRADFDVHETEIDGVPTFWADCAGPLTAILSFRVGIVDEPVARRGITHLVEHLALGPLGITDYEQNASVGPIRTMFIASGTSDEVVAFLNHASASFASLPTDRVLHERAVLRQEANERPANLAALLRGYRYGATGQGVIAEDEYGIGWLGPGVVAAWAAERFVRENAVLAMNRPPPAGLRLGLGSGRRWLPPTSEEPDGMQLPGFLRWPSPGAALTYALPRGTAASVAAAILHRRARSVLRVQDGTVYDVASEYEPLDGQVSHAMLGADTEERNSERVASRLLEVHDQLLEGGPTPEEVHSEAASAERQFEHPDGQLAFVDQRAENRLLGGDEPTPAEILDRRRTLAPEAVRDVLRGGEARMLVVSGAPNPAPGRLIEMPSWSSERITGEIFAPAGFHLPGRRPERLILGPEGVSIRVSDSEFLTVRFDEIAAAVHLPDRHILIGRDGFRVPIFRQAWRNDERLIHTIDAAIPEALVACDRCSPGALIDPEGRT